MPKKKAKESVEGKEENSKSKDIEGKEENKSEEFPDIEIGFDVFAG